MEAVAEISYEELFQLCAEDSIFYSENFFADAVRQKSPQMHLKVWRTLENPKNRYVNLKMFRGSAKTTIARLFMSKRIAYGISRTIMLAGKSQETAARSLEWVMKQVEFNRKWASFYGLSKGNKWTNTECEIRHAAGYTIRIIAVGITGSVRGINVDNYRPDLILVDDPCDEENTATQDAREKLTNGFFGAIKQSLAPTSECPEAMLLLLQTPLEGGDLTDVCSKDPTWITIHIPCLTSEDETIAESNWPQRWTKEELLADKYAAIARNQLSLWMREMMCTIISKELCVFQSNWLNYWVVLPDRARYVGAIDPAPILSDKQRQRIRPTTDYQALMVKCYWQNRAYIVEYLMVRDQDPDEVCNFMFNMNRKYPIMRWGVEGTAYQRTLKWYIDRKIRQGKLQPKQIMELSTTTDKFQRIVQAHNDRASNGLLYVHETHNEFIEQFTTYQQSSKYKDLLDVSALCDQTISPALEGAIEGVYEEMAVMERDIPSLEYANRCP